MKVLPRYKEMATPRVLRWLVDVMGGRCRAADMMKAFGRVWKGPAPLIVVMRQLVKEGWAELDDHGEAYLLQTTITVTPLGYIWRDYLDFEEERLRMTPLDMHVRIRMLEIALEPFSKYGASMRDGEGGETPTREQWNRAAEMMYPKNPGEIRFPWSPGRTIKNAGRGCTGPSAATSPIDKSRRPGCPSYKDVFQEMKQYKDYDDAVVLSKPDS